MAGVAASVIAVLTMVAAVLAAVNTIIENCERYYDNVNKILERINEQSEGRFVDELVEIDKKLKDQYKDLIRGMRQMAATIQAVHDEMERSDQESANEIKAANSDL